MTVVATLIFVVTLVLVIWQPKGLGIGWSALGGAVLAVITTVVSLSDIPTVWDIVWNATFAFVVIVLISLILDESGLFEWAALHVARWGRGNGRVLFVLIVILGAVIAALFTNDGAALILTPIVTVIVTVTVTASLGVLMLYLRKAIPRRYDPLGLAEPRTAIHDPLTFKAGFVVLGVLLVGYLAAKPLHIPLSAVAGLGAVVLALVASRKPAFLFARANNLAFAPVAADSNRQHVLGDLNSAAQAGIDAADTLTAGADAAGGLRRISVKTVFKETPWQIVLFLIGMYLFVYGLRNQGLTDQLAGVFSSIGDNGVLITALGVGVIVAALASIMNNMPTVLIAALTISAASATGLTQEVVIYANVIGSDPGPRTPDPGPRTPDPRSHRSAASPPCSGSTSSTVKESISAGPVLPHQNRPHDSGAPHLPRSPRRLVNDHRLTPALAAATKKQDHAHEHPTVDDDNNSGVRRDRRGDPAPGGAWWVSRWLPGFSCREHRQGAGWRVAPRWCRASDVRAPRRRLVGRLISGQGRR